MRYTPTLKLSTRLAAFVTMIVLSAMFILFVGGALSFQKLGQEYLNHYLQGVVEVVDNELDEPDAAYSMQRWIPKLLQASNIVEMTLSSNQQTIYHFKDTSAKSRKVDVHRLYQLNLPLPRNTQYQLHFKAIPPYIGYAYSIGAMGSTTLAIALIVFCLWRGIKWLKEQLIGSELLEERGRMILAGRVEQYAKGDEREWPYTASEALDRLIEELQDARQERSRFDTFIRTQTFLDQLTGAANRVLFDSKLESSLLESGARGGVMMLGIDDLDSLAESEQKSVMDELIVQVGGVISNIIQRYPDVVLSRYYEGVFAVFIPHQSSKDVASIAQQCLKLVAKITPPSPLEADNWCHIGISMYSEGEPRGRIINEVEIALKSAQLQGMNTWSRFSKTTLLEERGNVRWRTLFEQNLLPDKICLFKQACYTKLEDNGALALIHHELFVRIIEPGTGVLKASRFCSAIETTGYEMVLDKAVIMRIIQQIKSTSIAEHYALNLYVTPFAHRAYLRWFRDELMQLAPDQRKLMAFEFPEGHLVQHLDYMRPVIKMISALGCMVIVGLAGRTIVSTHYLKDLNIDLLKLHRSLVKRIDQRHENQLFVRSVVGVCNGANIPVIAVGVETEAEWSTLQALGVKGVQGRLFEAEHQFLPKKKEPSMIKPGGRNRWRK
jgi:RNase E specificity factor CsrD